MDKKPIDNFKFSKSNFEEEAYLKEELARLEEQNKILAARKAVLEKSLTNKKQAQEIYNKHNQDTLELKKTDVTNDIKQQQTLTQMQEENKKLLEEISALNKAKSDVKMKKHENKIEKKKLSIDEDISKKQQQYKLEEKELELEERKTFKLLYDKLTLYRASLSQFTKIKAQIPQYKIKYGQNFSDAKFNIDDFETYLKNNLPLLRTNFDRIDNYLSTTNENTSQKITYLEKELSSFQIDFEPVEKYLTGMKACMPIVDVNFKESFDKIQ